MAFNLGGPRLASFRRMRAAILDGIWLQAASEALHSRWARQVGRRSTEIIGMLVMGVAKDGY
jgi:lysozyme